MSKPTQKTRKAATRQRRSHHSISSVKVRMDKDGNPHLSHRAAPATGKYRGKKTK